ncbi:hypothetical protein AB0D12_32365 [Streptomyces sp. NPDC048479]|uniref:hypothetical protein n=1 Tax=Streptomyces sp. NPDC048479 TaxID=3154725 RepID=UPI00342B7867
MTIRRASVVLLALIAVLLCAPAASAHTELTSSTPKDGARLDHTPSTVQLRSPTESRSWGKASRRAISAIGGIHHPAEWLSGVIVFDRVEVSFYGPVCRFGKYSFD